MDGSRRLGQQGRCDDGGALGPRWRLRSTKLDKVFTYGIMATRGT
jgi:hypothetical protein